MSIHAFETARFSESILKAGSKAVIECIEVYDNNLFVGTSDGKIRHFLLEPEEQPDGLTLIHMRRPPGWVAEATVGKGKIQRIMAFQSLSVLLVLIDGRLSLFNISDLSEIECRHLKGKSGIKHYCRDSGVSLGSARTCEVVLALPGRGIASIEIFNDGGVLTVAPHRQFRDMPEHLYKGYEVSAMCRDGFTVCLALVNPPRSAKYVMYNLSTQALTELFEFDVAHTFPLIARVGLGEFLLTTWTDPQTMGMFANSKGSTSRAPIEFVEPPQQIAFVSPYILTYCAHTELVAVHSVLDQQQKQVLEASSLRTMCEADEELYISTGDRLTLIKPVSFEDQIAQLLSQRRVGEALQLAMTVYGRGRETESAEMRKQHLANVYRRAGLIQLTDGVFAEGTDSLFRGGVDPRVVITLFPGLQLKPLPVRLDDQLLAAQTALKSLDATKLTSAYNALISYLMRVRSHPQLMDLIDTALAAALALVSPKRLVEFVQSPNRAVVADCSPVLRQQNCFHAYALLLGQAKQYREALDLWKSLELGTVKDPTYPGLGHVIAFLAAVPDSAIVLAHAADWVLARDPKAVSLFMPPVREGETPRNRFEPDEVVNVLRPFPEATDVYLEYLVFALKNDEERFHTKLALSLLDRVTRSPDDPILNRKLLTHLVQSSRFDVEAVLRRVENTSMFATRAILYGKRGQHAKALDIFIHTLNDTEAAEQYCREYTVGKPHADRCALYLSLLEVYLSHSADPAFRTRAIDLLNAHTTELDLTKVLPLLPDSWGASVIRPFLWRSVRTSLNRAHTARVERGLARAHQIAVHSEYARLSSRAIVVTEESRCEVCDDPLSEGAFARFPNGRLAHQRCIKSRDADPITGATFD
eukprot:m.206378 g.206378  ORF g.206378 m.206378 type:complete len:870 (+) comp15536_c14_seq1:180-2789(+)